MRCYQAGQTEAVGRRGPDAGAEGQDQAGEANRGRPRPAGDAPYLKSQCARLQGDRVHSPTGRSRWAQRAAVCSHKNPRQPFSPPRPTAQPPTHGGHSPAVSGDPAVFCGCCGDVVTPKTFVPEIDGAVVSASNKAFATTIACRTLVILPNLGHIVATTAYAASPHGTRVRVATI